MDSLCILGLGEIGKENYRYCSDKQIDCYGFDPNLESFDERVFSKWSRVPETDVYIIDVPTHNNHRILSNTLEKVVKRGSELISIESTVTPGFINENLEKDVSKVHAPQRFWSEDIENHGIDQKRVIGADSLDDLRKGLDLYRQILDISVHPMSSIYNAELTKVLENSIRFFEISLAQELSLEIDDFEEIRNACNTKWNVDIKEARDGIGGKCLPSDIKRLNEILDLDIINKFIDSNKKYEKRTE